jgi:hypothetical protein
MVRVSALVIGVANGAIGYSAAIRIAAIELIKQRQQTARNPPARSGTGFLRNSLQLEGGMPITASG